MILILLSKYFWSWIIYKITFVQHVDTFKIAMTKYYLNSNLS